jgi:hypothetical protein
MRVLAVLLILGALVIAVFSYFDGAQLFGRIGTEVKKAEDAKRAQEIAQVKESYWLRYYAPPRDCAAPPTALRRVECKNQADQMREKFERDWTARVASGWAPPELAR